MVQTYEAWASGRPIFYRLPEVYQENEITDWLTYYWDELLINSKLKVDDLPRQLNPEICDANWLDFLAPLCGFTGEYWDKDWSTNSKRILLKNSYSNIWPNKGTRQVLSLVLNALDIEHIIWSGSNFVLGVSQVSVDPLGSTGWTYKILLPLKYQPNGYEFKLARKINKLFGNLWCESEVVPVSDVLPLYYTYALQADEQTFLTTEEGDLIQLN
ncbi:hypothetical protein H6G93_09205 [Nostoc sp. FACHB-973]|nr:hypothetical protein [Nostoc sp. FACHB-973]